VVGSLKKALEGVPSGRKDNFRIKLEGKWRLEIPQSGFKPQSGTVKPITQYLPP
jgi:hypothetical protein